MSPRTARHTRAHVSVGLRLCLALPKKGRKGIEDTRPRAASSTGTRPSARRRSDPWRTRTSGSPVVACGPGCAPCSSWRNGSTDRTSRRCWRNSTPSMGSRISSSGFASIRPGSGRSKAQTDRRGDLGHPGLAPSATSVSAAIRQRRRPRKGRPMSDRQGVGRISSAAMDSSRVSSTGLETAHRLTAPRHVDTTDDRPTLMHDTSSTPNPRIRPPSLLLLESPVDDRRPERWLPGTGDQRCPPDGWAECGPCRRMWGTRGR